MTPLLADLHEFVADHHPHSVLTADAKQMGTRIRRLRETNGRSQALLARRAKIAREHVNRLEAGGYDPSVGTLTRIAKALGVPVTELLE